MKKVFGIIFAVLFLNGCAQTTSMMGPTYTMAKTGSVVQAGSSVATSYGIKQALVEGDERGYFRSPPLPC